MMPGLVSISIRLPDAMLEELEKLQWQLNYITLSELVRDAIRIALPTLRQRAASLRLAGSEAYVHNP